MIRSDLKKYIDRISGKVLNKIVIKPWMEQWAVSIVEGILMSLQPQMSLEWGAGQSTIYFPKFLSKGAKWISVEHDGSWARKINDRLQFHPLFERLGLCECSEFYLPGKFQDFGRKTIEPIVRVLKRCNKKSNLQVFHVPPDHFPWTDEFGDGSYSDLMNYIEFPSKFGYFDFILIDGRARKDCLIKAYELVKDKGVVTLHDAGRKYYHEPFDLYKYQVLFSDRRNDESGLWLGSNGVDIKSLLHV